MKTLFFLTAGLFILVGCNSNTKGVEADELLVVNKAYQDVQWERGELSEEWIYGENNDTTKVTFLYSFAMDDSPLKKLTDSLTVSFMTELKVPVRVDKKFFQNEATNFLADFKAYESESSHRVYPWYYNVEVDYCVKDSLHVKGEFMMDAYTGGAHGSHYVAYRMINTKTNKIVQLADLFNNRTELDKRAEQQFRKEYQIDPNANLKDEGFWFEDGKFTLNENFYFDQHDIVFYFNPYEIGPYAMGSFTIHIPLDSLRDLSIKR